MPPLLDALRYPLGQAALITSAVVCATHLVASILPVLGIPLHLLAWLALYRYGMEAMAASAEGRADPPQGWSHVDHGVQDSHAWLQVLLMLAMLAATRLAPPDWSLALLVVLALVFPAAVMSLALGQNLWVALAPWHWWQVAMRLGHRYPALAMLAAALLWLQSRGAAWLDDSDAGLLVVGLYYLGTQHLALSLFRAMGLAWEAQAPAFEGEAVADVRRQAAHDAHEAALRSEAGTPADPADAGARARQLAPLLARGAPEDLHREYRDCLARTGDRVARAEHARVRSCELLALGDPRAALALACEGLADDPDLALPDAASTAALVRAAESRGLVRQAVRLVANYRRAYPKRYDGAPLALQAALLQGERLDEPTGALALLRGAEALAAPGDEREAFAEAIRRFMSVRR